MGRRILWAGSAGLASALARRLGESYAPPPAPARTGAALFCIVRMDFKLYSLFTVLGSAIWCGVLCYVGIKMGEDEKLMQGQLHRISLYVAAAMLALGATYYFFVHRQMKKKDHP